MPARQPIPASTQPPERPRADAPPTDPGARRALVLASLGFFLITLDILIVNVGLSRIRAELGGGTTGQQWVIDAYTLMFASMLPLAGNLSDRFGAKRTYSAGIAVFLVASIGCALAPTLGVLIGARAIQGIGAAAMLPASMAILREAFPDGRARARALGIWAVGGAVASAVGPVLGGLLTTIDWRLVFAINIPVCVAMLILIRPVATSPTRSAPIDWWGQLLAVVTLAALTFGLIEGGARGFAEPLVIAVLALAVVALVGFIAVQARGRNPMMPLDLFRPTGMRISLGVGFVFMVGNFGSVFLISLFLQQHLGLSPLLAGLVFLPSAVFATFGNVVSGTLVNRFGPRVPVVAGMLSMAVGFVALLVTVPAGSPVVTAVLLILTGAGGAVAMPPMASVVLASVPSPQAGTASAVFNTFRQVGGAVAIAVFGIFVSNPDHFVSGLQTSFAIAAILLLLAAIAGSRIPAGAHE